MIGGKSYNANISGVRNFILGKNKPEWYTMIIVLCGFVTWIWFFFGNLLGLLALQVVQSRSEVKIRANFERIGENYGLVNVMQLYSNMTILGLAGSVLLLVGLIFIWRRWLAGYFLFFPGLVICIMAPLIFMSYEFLVNEQSPTEFILPSLVFFLFLYDFYRWKKEK